MNDQEAREAAATLWSCNCSGPSPTSRANWCDRGCGRDYNRMTQVGATNASVIIDAYLSALPPDVLVGREGLVRVERDHIGESCYAVEGFHMDRCRCLRPVYRLSPLDEGEQ